MIKVGVRIEYAVYDKNAENNERIKVVRFVANSNKEARDKFIEHIIKNHEEDTFIRVCRRNHINIKE